MFRKPASFTLLGVVLALSSASLLAPHGAAGASSDHSAPAWSDSHRVVAGPVVAGSAVLVVELHGKQLELVAVNPSSGATAWSFAYSASGITPGVYLTPVSLHGVALNLAPYSSPSSGLVKVEGINVETGKVAWKGAPSIVTDTPTACGQYFCVNEVTNAGYVLEVLNPESGKRIRSIPGLVREFMQGLYQTDNFNVATVSGIGSSGKVAWTKTFSSLFGGSKYSPNGGWDFLREGSLDVGSVGDEGNASTTPKSVNMGDFKTIGVVPGTGKVVWSDAGMFDCMGSISATVPLICRFSGTAHFVDGRLSPKGVSVSLEGLDAATGRITWTRPVTDVSQLLYGASLRILDGHHFVVTVAGGSSRVIDLTNGRLAVPSPHATYWCQSLNLFAVTAVTGDPADGKKEGVYEDSGCNSSGVLTAAVPSKGSLAIGVVSSGRFIWPSRKGLEAADIPAN